MPPLSRMRAESCLSENRLASFGRPMARSASAMAKGEGRKTIVLRRICPRANCVTPLLEAKTGLFRSQNLRGAKLIRHRLRGEDPKLSSPLVHNFWKTYKGRGEEGGTVRLPLRCLNSCPCGFPAANS